jgi:hypothetical protein
MADAQYKQFMTTNPSSYASTILGGSAPKPKKAISAGLLSLGRI